MRENVYISGAIAHLDIEERKAAFNAAEQRLKAAAGVKVKTLGFRAYCQGRYGGQPGTYYTIWEEKTVEYRNAKSH